jgi:hypothetical protein
MEHWMNVVSQWELKFHSDRPNALDHWKWSYEPRQEFGGSYCLELEVFRGE